MTTSTVSDIKLLTAPQINQIKIIQTIYTFIMTNKSQTKNILSSCTKVSYDWVFVHLRRLVEPRRNGASSRPDQVTWQQAQLPRRTTIRPHASLCCH